MSAVTLISHMGSDDLVADAARVSLGRTANQFTPSQNAKLIYYLAKHGHWTPFGHPQATFHIEAPIYVARQLGKSQVGLVWNEVSRRYVDDEPTFDCPIWRERAPSVKQGSGAPLVDQTTPNGLMAEAYIACHQAYFALLDAGVAPEQARVVLPLSTMTEWYWTGSLAAFARVHALRAAKDAQDETREVAIDLGFHMSRLFPVSWSALTGIITVANDNAPEAVAA